MNSVTTPRAKLPLEMIKANQQILVREEEHYAELPDKASSHTQARTAPPKPRAGEVWHWAAPGHAAAMAPGRSSVRPERSGQRAGVCTAASKP